MALSKDTFFLDPAFSGSLQSQIRQIVTSAILSRRLHPGERLPSSRKLAEHLKISRITVTLSYQELVADGYLSTRSRSGYFVSENAPVAAVNTKGKRPSGDTVDWQHALQKDYSVSKKVKKTFNWREFPYPFNYGQADPTLFGHSNWRLCAHQALGKKEIDTLTSDYADHDDPQLIDFIVRHTLPRRGIVARPEQVLLTVGAQNALWMVSELLLGQNRCAAFENPGYPGVRQILRQSGCKKIPINVDSKGLNPAHLPPETNIVYTSPSHQAPTTVTMPLDRRQELLKRAARDNFIVVEDDYEFEMSFLKPPLPALKSLDTEGRVIYVGSFSKSLFPGLRLGYLVGSEPFIEQARSLRSTVLRHPPGHMQRTTANFLALGHYNALIQRMKVAFQERRELMADALKQEGLEVSGSASFGGSCFWMKAPEHVDTEILYDRLLKDGVLIEPGSAFFVRANRPQNFYRLAYSSIQPDKIEPGIRLISKQIKNY
ncbi:MAG: PLP-dependent aminotransferase family protein [Rhodobacteraceae bacterium]|nr:PLP-dependent aminotransferase family protein [Paracoccaceae bacterium]